MPEYIERAAAVFQPTRPLRGATKFRTAFLLGLLISTHAPLAGRDFGLADNEKVRKEISTHAPLAGRDIYSYGCLSRGNFVFQPTRPLRGATEAPKKKYRYCSISTHAPLAGRDDVGVGHVRLDGISTHAPLAGRDVPSSGLLHTPENFNPRAPCGARHDDVGTRGRGRQISTHAPLAGRDRRSCRPRR